MKIIARVEDLMFRAKIDAAARHLSTPVEFVATAAALAKACSNGAAVAFVELTPEILPVVAKMKKESHTGGVAFVGFLSHVDKKLAEEAREAGVDRVLARSQFSETLPDLILEFTSPGVERITEQEPELPEE
jgi:hypothetical protein